MICQLQQPTTYPTAFDVCVVRGDPDRFVHALDRLARVDAIYGWRALASDSPLYRVSAGSDFYKRIGAHLMSGPARRPDVGLLLEAYETDGGGL